MTDKLPAFKLGINGSGVRSNQTLLQRDLRPFYEQKNENFNKPITVPKQQPNIFFTPIDDNRELILGSMKNDLDYQLESSKTYLPPRF
jgi:hypothetical protein